VLKINEEYGTIIVAGKLFLWAMYRDQKREWYLCENSACGNGG
jgi:hypothetical protein